MMKDPVVVRGGAEGFPILRKLSEVAEIDDHPNEWYNRTDHARGSWLCVNVTNSLKGHMTAPGSWMRPELARTYPALRRQKTYEILKQTMSAWKRPNRPPPVDRSVNEGFRERLKNVYDRF